MIIECRGWKINPDNKLDPHAFRQKYQISINDNGIAECNKEEKCSVCPLSISDVKLRCPGINSNGNWQSLWTVFFVSRIDDKITCKATWNEPCSQCWLNLRLTNQKSNNSGR